LYGLHDVFIVCSNDLIGRFDTTVRELSQGPGPANDYPVCKGLWSTYLSLSCHTDTQLSWMPVENLLPLSNRRFCGFFYICCLVCHRSVAAHSPEEAGEEGKEIHKFWTGEW